MRYKYGVRYEDAPNEYKKLQSRDRRQRHPVKYLLAQAKYRAKQRGIPFEIAFNDLAIPTHCPVFGIPLFYSEGARTDNSYSLDRKDNTQGYVPGNVFVISWKANQYKGDLTIREVEGLLNYMKGN